MYTKWDSETIIEFAKRLKEHYPHSIFFLRAVEQVKNEMLEEKGDIENDKRTEIPQYKYIPLF